MSRPSERVRGFSLAEAMVSLTLLVLVMVVALTLLFTMRSFAERVQWVIEPRQTARRAVDYLAHFLQGATDVAARAPDAIVTYYNTDGKNAASCVQASYDNLTGAEPGNTDLGGGRTAFGDAGTDIVSLILPTGPPAKYRVSYVGMTTWPGYTAPPAVDFLITYREGCGTDDAKNMEFFKNLTRENGTGHSNAVLFLQDNNGSWQYFKINSYEAPDAGCECSLVNGPNIHVKASPGDSQPNGPIEPPGGHTPAFQDPVFLVTGLDAFSFRVRTDANGVPNLEQKNGLFDPATDAPGALFVPIIENVEDFQVAYLYPDGSFWNSSKQAIAGPGANCPACTGGVPFQAGPAGVPAAQDITNVMGLRFSIVARSRPVTIGIRQMSYAKTGAALKAGYDRRFRPAVENHAGAAAYDEFEHFRATVTVTLKNRMLGS